MVVGEIVFADETGARVVVRKMGGWVEVRSRGLLPHIPSSRGRLVAVGVNPVEGGSILSVETEQRRLRYSVLLPGTSGDALRAAGLTEFN